MQPTSQSITSENSPLSKVEFVHLFTYITDEGKKQEDDAAPAEEPAAEEAGAASGSAAGR